MIQKSPCVEIFADGIFLITGVTAEFLGRILIGGRSERDSLFQAEGLNWLVQRFPFTKIYADAILLILAVFAEILGVVLQKVLSVFVGLGVTAVFFVLVFQAERLVDTKVSLHEGLRRCDTSDSRGSCRNPWRCLATKASRSSSVSE